MQIKSRLKKGGDAEETSEYITDREAGVHNMSVTYEERMKGKALRCIGFNIFC